MAKRNESSGCGGCLLLCLIGFVVLTLGGQCMLAKQKRIAEDKIEQFVALVKGQQQDEAMRFVAGISREEIDTLITDLHNKYDWTTISEPPARDELNISGPVKMYTNMELGFLPSRDATGELAVPARIGEETIDHVTERIYTIRRQDDGQEVLIKWTFAWVGSQDRMTIRGIGVYEASDVTLEQE